MKRVNLIAALLPSLSFAAPSTLVSHRGSAQLERTGRSLQNGAETKAIYFLSVNPAGSAIVAIEIGSNGVLTDSTTTTSTQGVGLQSIDASARQPNTPTTADPLQGQNAVVVGNNYLFTVNSGSDTAVMFKINPDNPLELEMIGEPAATLGQFPMSVAYSCKEQKVCVLNGGAVNGVTCYNVDEQNGLVPDGVGLREFGFDSTTPPELFGTKGSGSDIQFTPDSSKLIVTFKGNNEPLTTGHIVVFDVNKNGGVAKQWTDNQLTALSSGVFGFALDPNEVGQMFVSDVSFGGGALLTLDYNTDKLSLVHIVNSTEFVASCWAEYSPETGMFYDIDAGSPKLGVIDPQTGALEGTIEYSKMLGGGFDMAIAGRAAYFLTGINVVAVIDLVGEKLVQEFTYGKLHDRQFWTGMASYPAEQASARRMRS